MSAPENMIQAPAHQLPGAYPRPSEEPMSDVPQPELPDPEGDDQDQPEDDEQAPTTPKQGRGVGISGTEGRR